MTDLTVGQSAVFSFCLFDCGGGAGAGGRAGLSLMSSREGLSGHHAWVMHGQWVVATFWRFMGGRRARCGGLCECCAGTSVCDVFEDQFARLV